MSWIGLPRTVPPKSSIAICAAATEPGPSALEDGPDMSVSTPIFTTSSEICAAAMPFTTPNRIVSRTSHARCMIVLPAALRVHRLPVLADLEVRRRGRKICFRAVARVVGQSAAVGRRQARFCDCVKMSLEADEGGRRVIILRVFQLVFIKREHGEGVVMRLVAQRWAGAAIAVAAKIGSALDGAFGHEFRLHIAGVLWHRSC